MVNTVPINKRVSQGNPANKSRVVTSYPIMRQHLWSDLLKRWLESSRSFWKVPAWWTSGNRNNLSHTLKLEASYDILNGNFLNCILQRYRMSGLVIHLWMSASLVSTTTPVQCSDSSEPLFAVAELDVGSSMIMINLATQMEGVYRIVFRAKKCLLNCKILARNFMPKIDSKKIQQKQLYLS